MYGSFMRGRGTMVGIILLVASPLLAEEQAPQEQGQRHFALSATAGAYSGFGGGVRLGVGTLAVHFTGAWDPLLVTVKDDTPTLSDLNFHSTFLASADLSVVLWR